jgi:hypothetical protein
MAEALWLCVLQSMFVLDAAARGCARRCCSRCCSRCSMLLLAVVDAVLSMQLHGNARATAARYCSCCCCFFRCCSLLALPVLLLLSVLDAAAGCGRRCALNTAPRAVPVTRRCWPCVWFFSKHEKFCKLSAALFLNKSVQIEQWPDGNRKRARSHSAYVLPNAPVASVQNQQQLRVAAHEKRCNFSALHRDLWAPPRSQLCKSRIQHLGIYHEEIQLCKQFANW